MDTVRVGWRNRNRIERNAEDWLDDWMVIEWVEWMMGGGGRPILFQLIKLMVWRKDDRMNGWG